MTGQGDPLGVMPKAQACPVDGTTGSYSWDALLVDGTERGFQPPGGHPVTAEPL